MAIDPNNPFGIPGGAMPGGDPFKKIGATPKASEEIFAKPGKGKGAGAAAGKKKAEQTAQVENDRLFEEHYKTLDKIKDPEEPPKPEVKLSNPKWDAENSFFNEKVKASVEGALPPGTEHRSRVDFTAYALPPNGERERIDAKEGHLKNGVAEADLTLWIPNYRDDKGNPLDVCDFVFVAKHRASASIESKKLRVSGKKTPRQLYEERLREAVSKLRFVGFGRAEGSISNPDPQYDDKYWKSAQERKIDLSDDAVLQLKNGEIYSDAIIAIIENPDLWKLDCMQFVQVCNLYAMIDPESKKAFQDGIMTKIYPNGDKEFCLRTFQSWIQKPFESTGLKIKEGFFRKDPQEKWTHAPSGSKTELELEVCLKKVPVGSRVSWSIKGAKVTNPYHTENTIKMGANTYAAHPFISDEPGPTGYLGRERIELLMGEKAGNKDPRFIKENIFISDIAVFEAP